jgi:glutamine amidotransferase
MSLQTGAEALIIDYGLGNLFSVERACAAVGIQARISRDPRELERARAVILPGVGAFGEAMSALNKLDLVRPLHDYAATGRPLMGVCLGMQLMLERSYEFGIHKGLGLLPGEVLPLEPQVEGGRRLKVPHIGWNALIPTPSGWNDSLLASLQPGAPMYFVHSFYCRPADPACERSWTRFGGQNICSSLKRGEVEAFQFHPERSGPEGLKIYQNLKIRIQQGALKP